MCRALGRYFPGPTELGVVCCTASLFLLAMALIGTLVGAILFPINVGMAGRYDETDCRVIGSELRDDPYMTSSEYICGRNRSRFAPASGPGSHLWPQTAAWEVRYDVSSGGGDNNTNTTSETSWIVDSPWSACMGPLPTNRLKMHPVAVTHHD